MGFNLSKSTKSIYYAIPILFLLFNPLHMNINQRIVFSSLLLAIIWWITKIVKNELACIFLLCVFMVFGNSTPYKVLKFAFTPSFYLIMLSFLLSSGINNSKAADNSMEYLLKYFGSTPKKIVFISFLFGILLIFFIPQPFSRVIILASIFNTFLHGKTNDENVKEILLFSIFVSSTSTSMLFLNGDIILNYSAVQLGGIQMSSTEWLKLMFVPSLITNAFVFLAIIVVFKSRLKPNSFKEARLYEKPKSDLPLSYNKRKISKAELSAVVIMIVVVSLWLTESLHGLNPAITALIGVIAMLCSRILTLKDIKSINLSLLLFLITAFSIGTVMKDSGIDALIFNVISSYMPDSGSVLYLIAIIIIVMGLHMFIGSSITTLSVTIPSFIQMTNGILSPLIVVLLCYVSVNIHYILPFQHVTIMIGAANNFYSDKTVMKFGMVLTIITMLSLLVFYIPWWKINGVL